MKRFKKHISFCLLLVLSFLIVPKELVHSLVDHNDTEDCRSVPDAPVSAEQQHVHCDFLKIITPLYLSEFNFTQFHLTEGYFVYHTPKVPEVSFSLFQLIFLRGPPAFLFNL
jgi:hypothetical protein